ncbi:MAG: hypothetical protein ACYCW6_31480 [Candidatus Xenobia bacterium]
MVEETRSSHTFRCETRVQGYALPRAELRAWLAKNPGFYLRLVQAESQDSAAAPATDPNAPARFCIACGSPLPPSKAAAQSHDPNASQMMSFNLWFHDECPIESNFLKWKHCARCGCAVDGEGAKARCNACNLPLPSLYQHCAVYGI